MPKGIEVVHVGPSVDADGRDDVQGAQAVLASPRTVQLAENWGTTLENATT